MNKNYYKGFYKTAAAHGVNPELLANYALGQTKYAQEASGVWAKVLQALSKAKDKYDRLSPTAQTLIGAGVGGGLGAGVGAIANGKKGAGWGALIGALSGAGIANRNNLSTRRHKWFKQEPEKPVQAPLFTPEEQKMIEEDISNPILKERIETLKALREQGLSSGGWYNRNPNPDPPPSRL